MDLPGRENYWYLKDVLEWLEERRQGLVARAITNPDQLAPDEVAPTMRMLAVRLIEQEFGEAVRPEHVSLTLSRTPKNDELTSCRAAFLERFEELCGHFSDDRTLFVVASAVPAFRQRCYESGVGDPYLLEDPDRLRRFAIAFLDDEVWAKFEAASKAPADKLALEN